MIERCEQRGIRWLACLVVVVTTVPYLLGYAMQSEALVFSGFLFGVEDGNSYIAKMLSGEKGSWLFRTPYTYVDQKGALISLPYILLGKLAGPPDQHTQLVALFHIFRCIAAILLVRATYEFIALFVQSPKLRRYGTALAVLGGGTGWLSLLFINAGSQGSSLPLEFYSPEAFGFLMAFGLPHLAVARALMFWGLKNYLDPNYSLSSKWNVLKTFGLWSVVGLMQPVSLGIGGGLICLHICLTWVWQFWKKDVVRQSVWHVYFPRAVWNGVLLAPLFLYTFIAFRLDPYLKLWEKQNILSSPPLYQYMLSYGPVLVLSVLGIRRFISLDARRGWLVVGWAFVWPILVYLPFTIQRRLGEGAWVALIILAFVWLEAGNQKIRRLITWGLSIGFISTLLILIGSLSVAWNRAPTVFRQSDEIQVFNFLASNGHHDDVVLATFDTSNGLPAWAAVKTITGHGPESIDAREIQQEVDAFFSTYTDDQRQRMINRYNVDYVIWDENAWPDSWDPRNVQFLSMVFQSNHFYLLRTVVTQ